MISLGPAKDKTAIAKTTPKIKTNDWKKEKLFDCSFMSLRKNLPFNLFHICRQGRWSYIPTITYTNLHIQRQRQKQYVICHIFVCLCVGQKDKFCIVVYVSKCVGVCLYDFRHIGMTHVLWQIEVYYACACFYVS